MIIVGFSFAGAWSALAVTTILFHFFYLLSSEYPIIVSLVVKLCIHQQHPNIVFSRFMQQIPLAALEAYTGREVDIPGVLALLNVMGGQFWPG